MGDNKRETAIRGSTFMMHSPRSDEQSYSGISAEPLYISYNSALALRDPGNQSSRSQRRIGHVGTESQGSSASPRNDGAVVLKLGTIRENSSIIERINS